MQGCFVEYNRVLKPGRWMTVVFHNSRNSVWNAIQEAMLAAGFVVADVRTLDSYLYAFGDPARYVDVTGARPEAVSAPLAPEYYRYSDLPHLFIQNTRGSKRTIINGSAGGELFNNGFPTSATVMNNLGSDSGGFSEGSLAGLNLGPLLPKLNDAAPKSSLRDLFARVANNDNGLIFDTPSGFVDTQVQQPTLPPNEVFTSTEAEQAGNSSISTQFVLNRKMNMPNLGAATFASFAPLPAGGGNYAQANVFPGIPKFTTGGGGSKAASFVNQAAFGNNLGPAINGASGPPDEPDEFVEIFNASSLKSP